MVEQCWTLKAEMTPLAVIRICMTDGDAIRTLDEPHSNTYFVVGEKDDNFFWRESVDKALKDWKGKRNQKKGAS